MEERQEEEKKEGGGHRGNLGLPFGLCAKYGITLPEGATPREAWDALKEKTGLTPAGVFAQLRSKGKMVASPKKAEAKPLSERDISFANSNSFFNRGDQSKSGYDTYAEDIKSWNVSEEKKQKLLDKLHELYSRKLGYEAQHVPWTVAGPANYNAKRLDKSSQIMNASAEVGDWFNKQKEAVQNATRQYEVDPQAGQKALEHFNDWVKRGLFSNRDGTLNPTSVASGLATIAAKDPQLFVEQFEKYNEKLHFKKNTNAYKLYEAAKSGEYKGEKAPEKLFADDNLNTYSKKIQAGDRRFLKFTTRPKPQMIYALKARGWKWNANEGAWSVPPAKYDQEFVSNISKNYAKYL